MKHKLFMPGRSVVNQVLLIFIVTSLWSCIPSHGSERATVSKELIILFQSARQVIEDHQSLINRQAEGKSFSAEVVLFEAKKIFKQRNGGDLQLGNDIYGAKIVMLASIRQVINNAQHIINNPELAFKGYIPAVFARQLASEFSQQMRGRMALKVTTLEHSLRNPASSPDRWETSILNNVLANPGYTRGRPFFEKSEVDGQQVFRYILPEYYRHSCLSCHGGPKGSLDITGYPKEGAKVDELAGAISLVLYQQ